MEMINENSLSIAKLQDQDLQLTTVDQVVELDNNELDNVTGGGVGLLFGLGYSLGQGYNVGDSIRFMGPSAGVGAAFGSFFPGPGTAIGAALSTPKE
jgi:hypothetical protein